MWFQIGVLLLVVAFFMYLGTSFGAIVTSFVINGVLIFIVVYRSYFEINAGRLKHHILAAIVALALFLYLGSSGQPFWTITLFLVTEYLLALLFHVVTCQFPTKRMAKGRLQPKYR